MRANVIWYRARPQDSTVDALKNLLGCVEAEIVGEQTTIRPELFSQLLALALGSGEITVVVGGLDQRSESENTVFLLSKCVPMPLEHDEKSRSSYVFDNFRAKRLPSFSQAVLFPSKNGGAEGFVMSAGEKTIIVLPRIEEEQSDMLELMEQYLPSLILGDELPSTGKEREDAPAYVKIAQEHRMRMEEDERRRKDMILSAQQVRRIFSQSAEIEEANETNRRKAVPDTVDTKNHAVRQKDSNAKFIARASVLLLLTVALITVTIFGVLYYEPHELSSGRVYQSELAELYEDNSERGDLPFGALTSFARLYAINSDVRGFLSIPKTELAQPVVSSPLLLPDYYESTDFYGNENSNGTLHLDVSNLIESEDDGCFNTVIYGSSPKDGSLFSELQNYSDEKYLAKHPIINFDTLYSKNEWIVFAICCVSDGEDGFDYAKTDFSEAYAEQEHLYNLYIRSMFYTQTEVLQTDSILTLVTDYSELEGTKLIVCARKVRDGEDISYAGKNVTQNTSCLMPDIWYELTSENRPRLPEFVIQPTTTSTAVGENEETTTTTANSTVYKQMIITAAGKTVSGPANEILAMIIEAEMGSQYELEALKAQAVVAYTYYLYSGGSEKAPHFSTKTPGERAIEAANAVAGEYISYNNIPVYTPYFAISAGCTADNEDINATALPYLASVECEVDKNVDGYRTVVRVSSAEVQKKVLEKKGSDLNSVADKNEWFVINERDENGLYVTSVSVGGTEMRGYTLYMSVLGSSYLQSACFYIDYDAVSDVFTFTSLGVGSGVGMSQAGANEYAKQGKDYVWIIEHFYLGTKIKK